MKRPAILAAAAFLLPATAGAQTVTKCADELGKWTCRTQPSQPQPHYQSGVWSGVERGYDLGRAIREESAPAPETAPPRREGVLSQALREGRAEVLKQSVITAIREGRCEDAKNLAIDGGDLDLADQALRLCTPRTAQ